MPETNYKSPHILNASSTLLGLCFVVFGSIRAMKISETTIIDEIAAFTLILFLSSSILSFISLRSKKLMSERYEKIADSVFLAGLLLLFVTAMLITFNLIK